MFDRTPENATRWRDLVDQLTPEQVARLEEAATRSLNCAFAVSGVNGRHRVGFPARPAGCAPPDPGRRQGFDRKGSHRQHCVSADVRRSPHRYRARY
jgi:hypothetical protein